MTSFWLFVCVFFVLVLVLSIAVLVLDSSSMLGSGFRYDVRACDQPSQHRYNPMKCSLATANDDAT